MRRRIPSRMRSHRSPDPDGPGAHEAGLIHFSTSDDRGLLPADVTHQDLIAPSPTGVSVTSPVGVSPIAPSLSAEGDNRDLDAATSALLRVTST